MKLKLNKLNKLNNILFLFLVSVSSLMFSMENQQEQTVSETQARPQAQDDILNSSQNSNSSENLNIYLQEEPDLILDTTQEFNIQVSPEIYLETVIREEKSISLSSSQSSNNNQEVLNSNVRSKVELDLIEQLNLSPRKFEFRQNERRVSKAKIIELNLDILVKNADINALVNYINAEYNNIIAFNLHNKKFSCLNSYYFKNGASLAGYLLIIGCRTNLIDNCKQLVDSFLLELTLTEDVLEELKIGFSHYANKTFSVLDPAIRDAWRKECQSKLDYLIERMKKPILLKLRKAINSELILLSKSLAIKLANLTDNFKNSKGKNPLHWAIMTGNLKLILTLISILPPALLAEPNNAGVTPIDLAAGNPEFLLKIFFIADITPDNNELWKSPLVKNYLEFATELDFDIADYL